MLDAQTRERLGRQLKALYEPVIDEPLDPRLAELLQQLESDKRERGDH
ncbi:NepR family anti-sigma factor [Methylorubrum sp. SB2]